MAKEGRLSYAQKLPGPRGQYLFDPEVVQAEALKRVAGPVVELDLGLPRRASL